MLDVEPIKARALAATKGPWQTTKRGFGEECDVDSVTAGDLGGDFRGMFARLADGEFVANARTDIPALILEVLWIREHLDRLRIETERHLDWLGEIPVGPSEDEIQTLKRLCKEAFEIVFGK